MTILEAEHNIGSWVEHRKGIIEQGVITSVSEKYIFVRFNNDHHNKAVKPEDLEFYERPRL